MIIRTVARYCRRTLTALGPSFIKAGQVLASRPDIVRADYMEELCTLQDDVPSFPDDIVSGPSQPSRCTLSSHICQSDWGMRRTSGVCSIHAPKLTYAGMLGGRVAHAGQALHPWTRARHVWGVSLVCPMMSQGGCEGIQGHGRRSREKELLQNSGLWHLV